jgi:hypothetical protein
MNDPDPCPRAATPTAPTRRDTRAVVTHYSPYAALGAIPERGPPEALVFDLELGNPIVQPCSGNLRLAVVRADPR